jgi:hypothetical protein
VDGIGYAASSPPPLSSRGGEGEHHKRYISVFGDSTSTVVGRGGRLRRMQGLFLTAAELEAGLEHIRRSPKDEGVLELIVCRPENGERRILDQGTLDLEKGLVGDNWKSRGNAKTPDGSANPETQITIMNSRSIALLARERSRWSLAGDQLFIDLDLGLENLPPGTQVAIGSAIIEITPPPHTGCKKFVSRFGEEAMQFVNSPLGRKLNLRGVNARVRQAGVIKAGEHARKVVKPNAGL